VKVVLGQNRGFLTPRPPTNTLCAPRPTSAPSARTKKAQVHPSTALQALRINSEIAESAEKERNDVYVFTPVNFDANLRVLGRRKDSISREGAKGRRREEEGGHGRTMDAVCHFGTKLHVEPPSRLRGKPKKARVCAEIAESAEKEGMTFHVFTPVNFDAKPSISAAKPTRLPTAGPFCH
jgi:hypothetical protein